MDLYRNLQRSAVSVISALSLAAVLVSTLPSAAAQEGNGANPASSTTIYLPMIAQRPDAASLPTFLVDIGPKFNHDAGYPADWRCHVTIGGQSMNDDASLAAHMALFDPQPEGDLRLAYAEGLYLRHEFEFSDAPGPRYVDCVVRAVRYEGRWYAGIGRLPFELVNRGFGNETPVLSPENLNIFMTLWERSAPSDKELLEILLDAPVPDSNSK